MIVLNIIIGIVALIIGGIIFYGVGQLVHKIIGWNTYINIGGSIILGLFVILGIVVTLVTTEAIGHLILTSIK